MAVSADDPSPRTQADGSNPDRESALTVIIAFAANVVVAVAKTVAAVVTNSAAMLAEATHSWADTANEVLLLIAQRRAGRAPDDRHPLGYGREVYVWSMFAGIGLLAVGAGVSITHGIHELVDPTPADDFLVAYLTLAVAAIAETVSFLRSRRQLRDTAGRARRSLWGQLMRTSDPTVRAVFLEDYSALIGLAIAAAGIGANQLTGSTVPDSIGSILIGVLLAVVGVVLIDRNRSFLVGEVADDWVWNDALKNLLAQPEVARVTRLVVSTIGAGQLFVTAAVDLAGEPTESAASAQLASLEQRTQQWPAVVRAEFTLSRPGEAALQPL